MKFIKLACLLSTAFVTVPTFAQTATPEPAKAAVAPVEVEAIVVTGSRIKRAQLDSASPLQVISTQDLQRQGISSAEQLNTYLTSNGTGADNLASNADVVSGAARGSNGLSAANLRSQGSGSTLVLLNGRRVAAHGLNGSAVDVNQIPFAAVERVEILKDGASAIYGTDAIGGVINYILKKNFTGVQVNGSVDVTQQGGGNRYLASGLAGYGDLNEQGFNIMGAVSYSWNKALRGDQRSYVNTFQSDRGLSVDTRGTPFATILPLGVGANTPLGTIINSAGTSPFIPGSTTVRASGGINVLNLPGQPGCGAIDGQAPYDSVLWAFPQARFACAWDTGRAAVLQQPINTLTYVGRGVAKLGEHELSIEYTGSNADSSKRFSNVQLTPNTSTRNYAYARNASNAAIYDRIANALVAAFPGDATLAARRAQNLPISFRWRCIECGNREQNTNSQTGHGTAAVEGPLFAGWNYQAGLSYSFSKVRTVLGSGYYYTRSGLGVNGIVNAINSGLINPFLFPGETQSQAGLDALAAASAKGVELYNGKYTTLQGDASVSGPLFDLPGGTVQAAIGIDYRREKYQFLGDKRPIALRPEILAAPFDDGNEVIVPTRTIKAAYVELLLPLFTGFEFTAALRRDNYSDVGNTTNPKFSFKYKPVPEIMFRGSYNKGFRVPSFNQIYNAPTLATYTGRDIADPLNCPGGRVVTANPLCQAIQPEILDGSNRNLKPEKSNQFSVGIVFQPNPNFTFTIDGWRIKRTDTLVSLTLQQLAENYNLFQDRYLRASPTGPILAIDQRLINAGSSITSGVDIFVEGGIELFDGRLSASLDGTYLIDKKDKIVNSLPFENQLGKFTFSGDLGLVWKHNLTLAYRKGDWSGSFTQIYRSGYTNQELPGVTDGSVTPPNLQKEVNAYVNYNASLTYAGIEGLSLTAGIKNIFNSDPPFAITYDSNTGSGSSWEPRVADPRGRSFTLQVGYKF
jgi:iron complex outermembrane recepter protein